MLNPSGSVSGEAKPGKRAKRVSRPPLRLIRFVSGALGRISPPLAASFAMRLFMIPPRYVPSEREAATLHDAEPILIPFEGRELRAWKWGSGKAVLLVHGWGGRASQMTAFVPPLTAAGCQVIAFDGPAHGHSEGRRSSLTAFVRAIGACAEAVGPLHAIIGHSMGSDATIMALARGVAAERVVLFGPTSRPAEYLLHFADAIGLPDRAAAIMRRRLGERYKLRWEDVDMPRIAEGLDVPVLIVHDKDDKDAAWKDGLELSQHWRGAEMVTTEGLGHRRTLRDPSVIERVVAWVTGVR